MGSQTGIAWTDHTFNPWRGCTKVSAGCANCYAEALSKRSPAVLGEWGPPGKRAIAAESYWGLPERWDRAAKRDGVRRRVFCASLSDVFEDRQELVAPRARLFDTIARTPHIDWLLLTKRPENVLRLWPGTVVENPPIVEVCGHMVFPNVWLGVSVEDQKTADERIPLLLDTPAAVRFVSYEPALGPVDFRRWLGGSIDPTLPPAQIAEAWGRVGLAWVIVGGESGPQARPCDVTWARSVRDQCKAAEMAFFMKQRGSLWYDSDRNEGLRGACVVSGLALAYGAFRFVRQRDRAGADPAEWPEDLRVREFPGVARG